MWRRKKIIFTVYNRQYTTNAFFMSSRHLTLLLRIQGKPVGIQSSSSPKTMIKSLSTMYSFPRPMYFPPQSHIFARCCASRSTGVTSTPNVGVYWVRSRWANRLTNAVLPDFAGPTNPTLNSCFCMVLDGWVKKITPILPWKKMMGNTKSTSMSFVPNILRYLFEWVFESLLTYMLLGLSVFSYIRAATHGCDETCGRRIIIETAIPWLTTLIVYFGFSYSLNMSLLSGIVSSIIILYWRLIL